MDKMKVAVIGCGTIANSAHIPAYLKIADVEIKYFCDIIKERADAAVEKYGCGTAILDYHDALNDPEIEAISVCTPNKMHAIISKDALRAGKNVLCEKPAARTYAEALEMQQVQHETGKVLNIGVVNRFGTAVNMIKKMIGDGELGEVYQVYVSFRAPRSIPGLGGAFTTHEIAGGGVLIDWGVHYLDIVMYCCGDPLPETVSGHAFSKLGVDIPNYAFEGMWAGPPVLDGTYDVEDFVTGLVRTAGPTITFNGAWAQNIFIPETFIDFMGTNGGIRLQYGGDFQVFKIDENRKMVTIKPEFTPNAFFDDELAAFVRCIRTGEKLPSHIDTVVITAKIMQAVYDSSIARREIVF